MGEKKGGGRRKSKEEEALGWRDRKGSRLDDDGRTVERRGSGSVLCLLSESMQNRGKVDKRTRNEER